MLTRIITALVALCVLIPVLIFSNTWVLPIAVAIVCFIGTYEALKCIGTLKKPIISGVLLSLSAAVPILTRLVNHTCSVFVSMACIVFAVILYFMTVLVFSKGTVGISEISISAFMSFYVISGFSAIVFLHDRFDGGHYTYLLVFIGAWITDVFAYFCGRLFGKHKLIPEVSPKKTVEGSIGGTLFSGVAFVLFGIILESIEIYVDQSHFQLFVFGVIAAVVAQIGDLCMSALKRHYGIKDFGKIFPGHGGVLDRFDSILSVSIVLLILNIVVSSI